jgi:hypothetical protein
MAAIASIAMLSAACEFNFGECEDCVPCDETPADTDSGDSGDTGDTGDTGDGETCDACVYTSCASEITDCISDIGCVETDGTSDCSCCGAMLVDMTCDPGQLSVDSAALYHALKMCVCGEDGSPGHCLEVCEDTCEGM